MGEYFQWMVPSPQLVRTLKQGRRVQEFSLSAADRFHDLLAAIARTDFPSSSATSPSDSSSPSPSSPGAASASCDGARLQSPSGFLTELQQQVSAVNVLAITHLKRPWILLQVFARAPLDIVTVLLEALLPAPDLLQETTRYRGVILRNAGFELLRAAVLNPDFRVYALLVNRGFGLQCRSAEDGRHFLHHLLWTAARQSGQVRSEILPDEYFRLLVARYQHTPVINSSTEQTALCSAVYLGLIHHARELLAAGANPNQFHTRGFSPLMFAARNGHLDLIRDFVAAGASINARALHGFTALHFGVLSLRPATVSLLLSLGADAKAPLYTTIYELYPPLIYSNRPLIRLNCLQGLIYFVSVYASQWRLRSLTRVSSQPRRRVLRPLTAIDFQLARLLVTAGVDPMEKSAQFVCAPLQLFSLKQQRVLVREGQWRRIRLLWIGLADEQSPLSVLVEDVVREIRDHLCRSCEAPQWTTSLLE